MTKSFKKYYVGIGSIFLVESLHMFFFNDDAMIDVYLFYKFDRFVDGLLFDIYGLYVFSLFSYWLIKINKVVFTPLFITSLATWVSYFLNYNQNGSMYLIPFYVILSYYYYYKWKKQSR